MQSLLRLDCDIDGHCETKIIAIDSEMRLVGTVDLQYRLLRSANIRQLFVDDQFRGQGIGTSLVNKCCRIAQAGGCETLGLVVVQGNDEAARLYEKLGFSFVYQYDNGDALMTKNLKAQRL
jgi:ribosomal protein S18 acetylase RimI-like enzyme